MKRVHIRGIGEKNFLPFFIISLIEHKSKVDYNVVIQIFRYMSFIWEDYEREMEKKQKGISRRKGFRYPPILRNICWKSFPGWRRRWRRRVYGRNLRGKGNQKRWHEEYAAKATCGSPFDGRLFADRRDASSRLGRTGADGVKNEMPHQPARGEDDESWNE